MDTLKGNLELFGLESIAGLLSSARKTGALRVAVDGLNGRLFFVDGSLVYATTRKHDGSVNDLRGRGTEIRDRRHNWSLSLPELLRHQITDVLVRILRRNGGEFVFDEGVTTTALPSGRTLSFSAAEMIRRARERLDEWREIEEAIPDSSVKYCLTPMLPPDLFELTVDARMWTFIAAIGDGASASDLAERLRIFEFPAAKKLAELVRQGLLVPVDAEAAAQALRDTRAARAAHEAAAGVLADGAPDVVVTMITPAPAPDAGIAPADVGDDLGAAVGGEPADPVAPAAAPPVTDPAAADPPVSVAGPAPGPDAPAETYGAETGSHALAEWGDAQHVAEDATVDTRGTSEVIADVARAVPPAPVPPAPVAAVASPEDGEPAPSPPVVDTAPARPAPLPDVPGPPPWDPESDADDPD